MATKYGGYMGKVLKIDLTTKEVSEYPFSDRERELFIGGKTMAAKILGDHLKGTEKAFSMDNLLVITTGPLTGTGRRVPAVLMFRPCRPRPVISHHPIAAAILDII